MTIMVCRVFLSIISFVSHKFLKNIDSHECGEEWTQKIPSSIQEPIKEFYSLGIDTAQSVRHELKAIQPQIPNQLKIANLFINNAQCLNGKF
jgi:hypothetical protein